MLGIGWSEMALVALVALVVVGPDRLPQVLRAAGRWYAKVRQLADDMRRAFVLEADRQDAAQAAVQAAQLRDQARAERAHMEATSGAIAQEPLPRATPNGEPPGDASIPPSDPS